MEARRILLIVGGGIAAYKALELVRLLRGAGVEVRAILTRAGERFVTPLSLSALTEQPVRQDLFDLGDEAEMGHIQLSRWADLLVVAPATADLLAKLVNGHADDLASTTLLATDKPVLVAPAMNVRMWTNAATVRNVGRLRGDGVLFVGPDEGEMACGEWGEGRMAEPPAILSAIEAALAGPAARPLAGRRALVTAGPTHEPLDPVRVLANRSSGRQGYAIAEALARAGAAVTLVSGPTSLAAPVGVRRVEVETAEQMLAACQASLPADVAVFAAAVADWRAAEPAPGKIKKVQDGPPILDLTETVDVLRTIATGPVRPRLVIGFAAETGGLEATASTKRVAKGADWIVANDVTGGAVFGQPNNTVTLVTAEGAEAWPAMSKAEVARRLVDRIAEALDGGADRNLDVLMGHLPRAEILAMFARGGGDELGSGKFMSPESSAALAANIWGYFVDRPGDLPLSVSGSAERVSLEGAVRLPWSGGRHPCLDVLVETAADLIGVESKRYEPFRSKGAVDISDAYDRDVWGDRMTGWQRARDMARAGAFERLDVTQLVKHALGLLEQGRRRGLEPHLIYAFAEPSRWFDGSAVDQAAKAVHRQEIARLATLVSGDTVSFAASSYADLLAGWRGSSDDDLRRHAQAVLERFDV